jgi:UDP-N-acetylglucosamine--N-acetylmuramyl-(pentapeptide) pyrophosphoryl-undecaprenol N-acetylglucosamine transferase
MNILIAAAKTGGHVYPAAEICKVFINNGHRAIFIGTNSLIEKNALKDISQVQYEHINMQGFRGNGILHKILVILSIPLNIIKTLRIIWVNQIDSIIVFGGFITIPVSFAGLLFFKPIYVHEQNTVLGSANKIISTFSKKIFLGLPLHNNKINKSEITGNPIRQSFIPNAEDTQDDFIKIYITGGSQGAQFFNEKLPMIFNDIKTPIFIKHQCGKDKKLEVIKLYGNLKNIDVEDFFNNPNIQIDWADFVISRSGALSISEITAMKKGSLLIPIPNSIDNHQLFNARYIERNGMGVVFEQNNEIKDLKDLIENIIWTKQYLKWQEKDSSINHIDAANKIYNSIMDNTRQ